MPAEHHSSRAVCLFSYYTSAHISTVCCLSSVCLTNVMLISQSIFKRLGHYFDLRWSLYGTLSVRPRHTDTVGQHSRLVWYCRPRGDRPLSGKMPPLLFPLFTTREAVWPHFWWHPSACMSVCNTITFESIDVESSFLVCWYMFSDYGSSSYEGYRFKIKVTGAKSVKLPIYAIKLQSAISVFL